MSAKWLAQINSQRFKLNMPAVWIARHTALRTTRRFFPRCDRNHCQYSLHLSVLPTEGWPGWVGRGTTAQCHPHHPLSNCTL